MPTSATIQPIVISAETSAGAEVAWNALTDPVEVARWFADCASLGEVGAPYWVDFGDGSRVEGRLQEVAPGRRFSYTWTWQDADPREETLVTWVVERLEGGGCRITLRHDGWTEAGADEATRDDHATYWRDYVAELIDLLAEA